MWNTTRYFLFAVVVSLVVNFRVSTKFLGNSFASTSTNDDGYRQISPTLDANIPDKDPKRPSLIITGAIQNAESHLDQLKKAIEKVLQDFELVRLVIFEDGSTDRTNEIIDSWSSNDTVFLNKITRLPRGDPPKFGEKDLRTQKLAFIRNQLWAEIVELSDQQQRFDYVLMMDFDDVNYYLAHTTECFNLPANWTICCANQYTIFYDLWPLRTKDDWVQDDVIDGLTPMYLKLKFRHIPASMPPILVDSCFGGASLFRWEHLFPMKQKLKAGLYKGTRKGRKFVNRDVSLCEHLGFNNNLLQLNPNLTLWIQPKFLNNGPGPRKIGKRMFANYRRAEWQASMRDPSMAKYYEPLPESEK